jgi:D-alanyl-D-alanine carboxypeptidase
VADLSDLNPEFASRLAKFRDALNQQGIQNSLVSGYRSPEYQNQMYQNHLAKVAEQSLPYPGVEAPAVVAPPWRSFHNYGIATDFQLGNDADYSRLQSMAPQYGLSGIGMSDKGHIQLAGNLDQDIAQYKLANWRPDSQPAPATGAIAYGGPSRPVSQTPGTTLNSSPMDLVSTLESGNTNVLQKIHDKNTDKGTPAGGFFQIIDPTWQTYAKAAGVDVSQYPSAMSAPRNIQAQVAAMIPVNQWGPNTVAALKAKYPGMDTSQTLGQWQSAALGGSGSPASAPPATPGAAAAGPTLPGYQPGSPANKMAQDALKKLGGGGTSSDPPPEMNLPQAPQAQAMGGSMMMRPGGQNVDARTAAMQALQQQGFMVQPTLAANTPMATSPVVASQGVASAMPGMATGMTGIAGTTLNSPSALQMALMSGQFSPYDAYGRSS